MTSLSSTRGNSGMIKSLWYLCVGSPGAPNRIEIIGMLQDRPRNANEIADQMSLDYNTVRHHLDKLIEHDVVESGNQAYGTLYFLTRKFKNNEEKFEQLLNKTDVESD